MIAIYWIYRICKNCVSSYIILVYDHKLHCCCNLLCCFCSSWCHWWTCCKILQSEYKIWGYARSVDGPMWNFGTCIGVGPILSQVYIFMDSFCLYWYSLPLDIPSYVSYYCFNTLNFSYLFLVLCYKARPVTNLLVWLKILLWICITLISWYYLQCVQEMRLSMPLCIYCTSLKDQ